MQIDDENEGLTRSNTTVGWWIVIGAFVGGFLLAPAVESTTSEVKGALVGAGAVAVYALFFL